MGALFESIAQQNITQRFLILLNSKVKTLNPTINKFDVGCLRHFNREIKAGWGI
ncbi:hypothetical protein Q7I18_08450 [Aeromonas veronii]|uniref:hypothetical protein n=1 Tax=Aeromonas veronii TaxID=654 RepID=UPI0030071CB1